MKAQQLLLAWLFLPVLTFSQQPLKPIAKRVAEAKISKTRFQKTTLFEASGAAKSISAYDKTLAKGQMLSLKNEALKALARGRHEAIEMTLPTGDGHELTMELVRHELFTDDFKVVTSESNGNAVPYNPGIYYRGIIKGMPNSIAAISIFEGEVVGVMSTPREGNMVLGAAGVEKSNSYIFYKEKDLLVRQDFECGADDPSLQLRGNAQNVPGPDKVLGKCVRAYLECEYDMALEKGGLTGTVNFMTGLFNVVAALYQNENISMPVSEIFVWTTPDTYGTNSSTDALYSFRAKRPTYNGDIAHLVSRGAPASGGVAWINALCSSYAYGYSYIFSGYSQMPFYSWSAEVIAHEMGHNLGSPHTHACSWNGNNTPIDGCGAQAGYSEGCTGPVPVKGTVMSYCHLLNGVGIDFSLGFGQQPGDLIRSRIANASCLSNCTQPICLTATATGTNPACYGSTSGSASVTVSGGTAPFSFLWQNSATTQSIQGLPAGVFTVTVTDATGCSGTSSVSLSQPTALKLAATLSNESFPGANDGSVNLTAEGATAPYTFLWSNGMTSEALSGLGQGTYSVTATDAKGCSNTTSVIITSNGCGEIINAFPYFEGFETGPGLWKQETSDHFDWTRDANGTPTSRTGPSSAKEGSWYMYTEASGNNSPFKTAILTSPCIDLNNLSNASLNFSYHMYGANIGTLKVEIGIGGSNYTTVWERSGQQGNQWLTETINLEGYHGKVIKIRFAGITGNSYRSDMAIDAVGISGETAACDPSVITVMATNASCPDGNDGSASVAVSGGQAPYIFLWSNGATSPFINALPVGNYTLTVADATGCTATASVVISSPPPFKLEFQTINESAPGATNGSIDLSLSGGTPAYNYLWSNGAVTQDVSNLSAGVYAVTTTDALGCTASGTATIETLPPCNPLGALPHEQGFETGFGQWQQSTDDETNWTIDSGGTPTSNTGPTSALEGNFFAYTEASGFNGKTAILISPCFELSLVTNPRLTFSYHMRGNQMGTLRVDISTDAGSTWSTLWALSGNQGNYWFIQTIDLANYASATVKLRFVGIIGGYRSDMAIDAIQVGGAGNTPAPNPLLAGENAFGGLTLGPNPASEDLHLRFHSEQETTGHYFVTDLTGKQVGSGQIGVAEGSNQHLIDVRNYSGGIYFLTLIQGKERKTGKFLVLK